MPIHIFKHNFGIVFRYYCLLIFVFYQHYSFKKHSLPRPVNSPVGKKMGSNNTYFLRYILCILRNIVICNIFIVSCIKFKIKILIIFLSFQSCNLKITFFIACKFLPFLYNISPAVIIIIFCKSFYNYILHRFAGFTIKYIVVHCAVVSSPAYITNVAHPYIIVANNLLFAAKVFGSGGQYHIVSQRKLRHLYFYFMFLKISIIFNIYLPFFGGI